MCGYGPRFGGAARRGGMLMRKPGLIAVLVAFSILNSCGGSGGGGGGITPPPPPPPPPGDNTCPDNTFCLRAASFQPTSLTVAKGTTVSFTNNSGVEHNVIFDSPSAGVADIGSITSGTANRSFATAGTFAFHCTIHAGMNASVTVQ
jgi:hypothetical protein